MRFCASLRHRRRCPRALSWLPRLIVALDRQIRSGELDAIIAVGEEGRDEEPAVPKKGLNVPSLGAQGSLI